LTLATLANSLVSEGAVERAEALLRQARRRRPGDFWFNHELAGALMTARPFRLDEAICFFSAAVALRPSSPGAHLNFADVLHKKGWLDEAIAECREALRLKKDYADAHNTIGVALRGKGRLDEAIAEHRKALRLKKDFGAAHFDLAMTFQEKGQLDEAIAEYREVLRLKGYPAHFVHNNLGSALMAKGRLDEAIAEYRDALLLKKNFPLVHCNLGHALRQQGHFGAALKALKRGHELGSKNPRWPYPSAQWVRECQRFAEFDKRLPAILSGEKQPANAAERLVFAKLCQLACKQRFAAASRLYAEAFAAQRTLAEDQGTSHRYNAACAAALAGCGQGQDAGKLDGKERSRLREQARDWLAADLRAWRNLLQKEPKTGPAAAQQLAHWLVDTDFAGVRGEKALQQLPQAEREAWLKLWTVVQKTLVRERSPAK
jgi:tetratricopeptide (TPR) repeat protein